MSIKIFDIIMGILVLLSLGTAIYIDYPNFEGLSHLGDFFFKMLFSGAILYVIGISLFMTGIMYLLLKKLEKDGKALKVGDKVFYDRHEGVIIRFEGENGAITEMRFPRHMLQKVKLNKK